MAGERRGETAVPRTSEPRTSEPRTLEPRTLEVLAVPTGPTVLSLRGRIEQALAGTGPALLPVPLADPGEAARLAAAMRAGTALAAGEDSVDDPTALVIATSGSTGDPKGALLPSSALRASAAATRRRLLGPHHPADEPLHWLLALPAHHIAGLQVLLRAWADDTEPTVMDVGNPFTAEAFAAAVARMPGTFRCTSLVPTQLHRVLSDRRATATAAGLTAVLVGGAATGPTLLARARAAGIPVVTTYGMSETCGGCVYDGIPLDGVRIDIEAPTGPIDAAVPHRPGRVSIAGAVVARGYRGRPADPAFASEPNTDIGARRFGTSDLGRWDADGRLQLAGRDDDVIITGGVKIDPSPVEDTLTGVAGVAQVVVTGVADPEWGQTVVAVVVAHPGQAAPGLDELRRAATRVHGAAAAPRRLLLADSLPLRGPGKPDRVAIGALAARLSPGLPAVQDVDHGTDGDADRDAGRTAGRDELAGGTADPG